MKRVSVVALSIAAAAFTLLITQLSLAQSAPSNDTPCASMQNSWSSVNYWPSDRDVRTGWFDLFQPKPCAAMKEAAMSNDTSTAEMQENVSPVMQQAMEMVPAQASLNQFIDANKVKQGDQITATLDDRVQLKNGSELPGGTELVGQVTVNQMQDDGTYRLALVFNNAQLKDGKVIPIKATIVRFYRPSNYYLLSANPTYYAALPPNNWTDQSLQVDQHNALDGVDLHSSIDASNSGNFVSNKKDEIKLLPDTVIGLAIAEQGKS